MSGLTVQVGDRVYWNDPERRASGFARVQEIDDSVVYLALDAGGEVAATLAEIEVRP